ncbi:IS1 family transposase [Azospirillum canadense]|uniref:IS1 family transposase n=1 Tax=Azospirillum canadense TaxID=403962 RepID=UPI002227D4B3|nr:IS1 family transposase [Azospirillum canadense]MCW2241777.1 IS1 family transposase/transposase-like protein [Azospirillum canadense]
MGERPWCPRCGSVRVVKSGHVLGKQRWLCRSCGFQFTRLPDIPVPEPTKQAAVTLYGHGLSLRAVGKLLGTTGQSVLRWVCQYVDRHCSKPIPEPVTVIEIDEMWHYLGCKAQKLWIWKAYDRDRGRLIDWECGKRDEATFRRLYERLQRWGARLFCTDQFAVYDAVMPVGRHYQGKDQSVALERNNGRQRHWVGTCRRKSIIVCKSKAMVNRRMALFAHLHVNDEAGPEMHRLPGISLQRKALA